MSTFPYPGLRSFQKDEADIFFGREEQVDQLLEKLERSHFLAVVGVSGCGKSSLVRAGLLSALEAGFLAGAGMNWRIAILRPGIQPMRNLATALLAPEALGPERGLQKLGLAAEIQPDVTALLLASLRRGPLGLVEVLQEARLPEDTNLLVLVDQFEDIFRCRVRHSIDEAEAFVTLLLESAEEKKVPLYVVITMRSDFIGDCTLFAGLPEALNESQFLTPRLTREQCRQAISGPARMFGGVVEPALENQLLNEMGANPDQLPLMQHALMRLWKRAKDRGNEPVTLTLEDYQHIGGLQEALSQHADEAYEELNDERSQAIAKVLFCCLCEQLADRQDIRQPMSLERVAAVAAADLEEVKVVVEAFSRQDRCFLTLPVDIELLPETLLDISHESLIRQWRRLREWIEEETKAVTSYRRLLDIARSWNQNKKDELLSITTFLENELKWWEQRHPNAAWAELYGGDFEIVIDLVNAIKDNKKQRGISYFNWPSAT